MADIMVLNRDYDAIGMIDEYNSLIWAERYYELGDCELYISATPENFALLKRGNVLCRYDTLSACEIVKIELDTDAENGDYLIVSGVNIQGWLDRRIIWGISNSQGKAENYIRKIVDNSLCGNADAGRQITKEHGGLALYLSPANGYTDPLTIQSSYANVGEKTRELCRRFGWGYKVRYNLSDHAFYFGLYKGQDRSDSVIFSDQYENLITTKYVEDNSNIGNVALIAGEGEGANRSKCDFGDTTGAERYEIYVDARDISSAITYAELKEAYPLIEDGGDAYIIMAEYRVQTLNIQIANAAHLTWLVGYYGAVGTVVEIDGVLYYRVTDALVANLVNAAPQSDEDVETLDEGIYMSMLYSRGEDKLAEYGAVTSFEGTIEPNTTFVLGVDYNLGDIVKITNRYGVSVNARITEIIEVWDGSGYSVEPKYEYITEE